MTWLKNIKTEFPQGSPIKHSMRKGGKHIVHSHKVEGKGGGPKVYSSTSARNRNESSDASGQRALMKRYGRKN